jgi:hypothetical protein
MIIKRVYKNSLEVVDTHNKVIAWLTDNIGAENEHVKYHNPDSAILSINESFENYQNKWQAILFEYRGITGATHEPKRITWYKGEGWDIIRTVHYEPAPGNNPIDHIQFVSNVYSFYVAVEDDLLAVQLNLTVL